MLSESTSNKIQMLYKKYLNDISLFTEEDLKLLMDYFSEHPLFCDIPKTKGFTVLKKILTNIRLKTCEKHDTLVKFDSQKNVFNILLYGNIKKRNLFKGLPKEEKLNKNSGKYLYCVFHCLSNSLFAEIDRHVYMKYLVSNVNDLYEKFLKKIRKYSFFANLPDYQCHNLFLNYQEKKYGPHETIYEEEDKIDGVYLIIKGKCLVLKKKINNYLLDNNSLFYQNNFLTISNNGMNEKKKEQNNSKLFHPIFAKDSKNNNVLLTMVPGDIFGDLEINLNNNKREFSVKCGNYNKTKIWYFSLDIIENIINNFKDLSMQKYDIIKTRFEYANLVNKVKKDNAINKNEMIIDDALMKAKTNRSNFRSLNQKINMFPLSPSSNNSLFEKASFQNRNLLNNVPLISSRNQSLNTKSKHINKNNLSCQSKPILRILPYQSPNERNIISILKENNYIKKAKSNMQAMNSNGNLRINKINQLNLIDQKLFLKKINKNKKKNLVQCSNNETF